MNKQRIREIANQCSDFAEQIPYFRGIENGLTWEATIQKARDLKFAELIVKETLSGLKERIATRYQGSEKDRDIGYGMEIVYFDIVDKFGVEE